MMQWGQHKGVAAFLNGFLEALRGVSATQIPLEEILKVVRAGVNAKSMPRV